MAKKKTSEATTMELPVQYGKCSIGDKTASITVKIDRQRLSLAQADKHLCGMRLTGTLFAAAHGDTKPGQDEMFDEAKEMPGSFDVDGFGVTEKRISATLSFKSKEMDFDLFGAFANRSGRIVIEKVESSDATEEDDDVE